MERVDGRAPQWFVLLYTATTTCSLSLGSFTDLTRERGKWDIVVSSEVIEHLDPEPLALFAPTILGDLKPKIFVVTTPNRDFNKAFDLPLPTPPSFENSSCHVECDTEGRYWREGVPYPMRHHDHRFEWTRQEFQAWANKAAEQHGYDVYFTGVGTLKNGLVESNSDSMRSVVERELLDDDIIQLSNALAEAGIGEDPYERANRLWGDCSQIAVFTIKPETETPEFPDIEDIKTPYDVHCLIRKIYPAKEDNYPPSVENSIAQIIKSLPQFLPHMVATHWDNPPSPDAPWEKNSGFNDGMSELESFEISEDDLAERRLARRREKREQARKDKLSLKGLELREIVAVVGEVSLQEIWESSWELRRSWRFHFDKFLDSLRSITQLGGDYWQVKRVADEIWGEKIANIQPAELSAPINIGQCASSPTSLPSIIPDEGSTEGERSPTREKTMWQEKDQADIPQIENSDENDGSEYDYHYDSDDSDSPKWHHYDPQPLYKRIRPLAERMAVEFTIPLIEETVRGYKGDLKKYFNLNERSVVLHMDPVRSFGRNGADRMIAVKYIRPTEFDEPAPYEPVFEDFPIVEDTAEDPWEGIWSAGEESLTWNNQPHHDHAYETDFSWNM